MPFKKHKAKLETFFKEKLPFMYNIAYIRKRLEDNSLAFSYSGKLLKGIFKTGRKHYKFILAVAYLIGIVWQAYMISDVVPFAEGFYYIGIELSVVLMIKTLTILILTIAVCFMTVWIMFLLPFIIASIIPTLLIGNALFDYKEMFPQFLVPGTTIIYLILINWLYYKSKHTKQISIKAGVILFYIFAGLFFTVLSTGALQKKTSDVIIELRDDKFIEGKLHFYNGTKYFVSYTNSDTGEDIKEIVNGVSTISVRYE